ncbi:NUDIX domain-containing protein [Micromonospora sp. WMMD1128]|uniref:NUDIX domain-containing protein n=1 Tax=Micromonospora sp. WMMD1128 TaxID=3015150 RepID=UPI00248AF9D0|nr:NUDIX domain-containing protein [Micromonospora sp. WMMD1128]WBB73802.1 NUDIX domain-containing protein [Micromonospora sp. WMMD1128]
MPTDPLRCAGALIVDDDSRIFVQRRAPGRRLFPNCWDIAGGHLEPGEEIDDALRREVTEETGWTVSHVLGLVGEYRYTADDGLTRVETDFLVRVDGDLSRPRLEPTEHTEFRWLAERDIALLDEHRDVNDGMIRRILADGFAALRSIGL